MVHNSTTTPLDSSADTPSTPGESSGSARWLGRRLQRHSNGVATPYVVAAVVLAAAMWPAWISTRTLVSGGDATIVHYPWFVLWRDLLGAGEWPFWNPYSFSGIPAFATPQAGYGYPPHWLLTPVPPILAMNWLVGGHVLLAGLGTVWCASRLGASRDGQVVAGLSFALGSALVARIWAGHLSFVETNAWLPWATGLAAGIGRRHAVSWLAVVVGMMALANQPEIGIFSLWWLPLWALAGASRLGQAQVVRALVRVGAGLAVGVGLAAFQIVPIFQLLSISNRQASGMGWDFLTGASLPPWHLLGAIAPLAFGSPTGGYWPGPGYEWHERLLYVGVVPLLAAAHLTGRWRRVCWGAALVAVALAFGRYAPWYALTQWLPGYSTLRIPSKHLTLAALALALAAGLGWPRLAGRRSALGALGLAAGLLVAGLTLDTWLPPLVRLFGDRDRLAAALARDDLAQTGLAGLWPAVAVLLASAAILLLPWERPRRLLLLAVAAAELVLVLSPFRSVSADPAPIVANARLPEGRLRVGLLGPESIVSNFGPLLRVQLPGGYVSLYSAGYMSLLVGGANPSVVLDAPPESAPILLLLGYDVLFDRQAGRVTVVEPPPARAWVARCVWGGGTAEVRAPDFPRSECVTRAGASGRQQPVPPGPARIVAEGAGWQNVEADGPGWLVTTQPWYPGWTARVDGSSASVEVLDGALVGVQLGEGAHTVSLRYWPGGLGIGLAISGLSIALLVLAWVLDRRAAS